MRVSVRQNGVGDFVSDSAVFLQRSFRHRSNFSRRFSTGPTITPTCGNESSKGCGLGRGELPGGTNQVNGIVAACRVHLPHDPADMTLHSELRQIQVCRDFFIRHAVGHKPDELELPGSEGLAIGIPRMRWREFLRFLFAQVLNQSHTKARGTSGFPTDRGTHGRDDLRGRSILEQVPANPQEDRVEKDLRVLVHAEKKQHDSRVLVEDVAQKGRAGGVVEAIRQDDITMRGDDLVLNALRMAAYAGNVNLRTLSQEPSQSVAQQSVFSQEVNANLGGHLEVFCLSHIHPQFNASLREG